MKNVGNDLENGLSRREFLKGIAVAGSMAGLITTGLAGNPPKENRRVSLCIFSKHLQWLDYNGMAEATAELGFDGVALTVRPRGHVLPERAEDDLPKAAEACKKAGIEIPMMVTSITDPNDPTTEPILKTASQLGIHYYRLGYMHYNEEKGILEQLEELKPRMRDLAAMNKEYKIFGGNHNHSGNYVGGSFWDTWELFKDLDPKWIGFQFDTGNAFNEGAGGTWRTNARLVAPRTKMLAVKTKAEWANPEWQEVKKDRRRRSSVLTPADFNWFFNMLKNQGFSGPLSTHYEFSGLGGAENGSRELKGITRNELLNIIRKNLTLLKSMLRDAELV